MANLKVIPFCVVFLVGCSDRKEIKLSIDKLASNLSKIETENQDLNAQYLKGKAEADEFMALLKSAYNEDVKKNKSNEMPQPLSEIAEQLTIQIQRLEKRKLELLKENKLQRDNVETYRATYVTPKAN